MGALKPEIITGMCYFEGKLKRREHHNFFEQNEKLLFMKP